MVTMTKPPRFRGLLVRQLRVIRGWSQSELARRVGITRSRMGQLEEGAVPSLGLAVRLGAVLVIDWRRLFEDAEEGADGR
jgi:transcriptional regulator with XRE-family HTH domain